MARQPGTQLKSEEPSYGHYLFGFGSSVLITSFAFYMVALQANNHQPLASHNSLRWLIGLTAVVQCVIQLVCFLHLGREGKPRWKLLVFGFMLGVVGIIVGGSIWIMGHLNYNMNAMSPSQMQTYMQANEGL